MGDRNTSIEHQSDVKGNHNIAVPLLPGTRAMYKTSGSFRTCVGFLGYGGGFEASEVSVDRDLASMACADIGTRR